MKIMLADDEQAMRTLVERIIQDIGYEFVAVNDGTSVLEVFEAEKPDLLLLDVMLPGMDGFEVCQELRARGVSTPVIFLSAKGDIVDRRVGFSSGADDYIVKPFSPQELTLRVKANLREQAQPALDANAKSLSYDGLEIDLIRHLVYVDGVNVDLTPKEYKIFSLLAAHPGEAFTKEQLINEVWGKEFVGETTSLAVFIRKIREKIEADPSSPRWLQTVWHVGYRFGD
jgi:two-component system response regulator VicR